MSLATPSLVNNSGSVSRDPLPMDGLQSTMAEKATPPPSLSITTTAAMKQRPAAADPDDPVTMAAQNTAAAIARDSRLPDLFHLFNGNTLSRDYSFVPTVQPDLQVKKLTVLPEVLLEYVEGESPVLMGLLPEIGRAWLATGPRLFLYDCQGDMSGGRDVIGFEEPTGAAILNVVYAPAKPGIFVESICGVLLVATPTSLQVVAVQVESLEGPALLQLHSTDLVCGTEDINMLSVHVFMSTDKAMRIFLGGADGCLYEFEYEAVDKKRSLLNLLPTINGDVKRRCRLRNHSESFLASALIPNILKRHSPDPIIKISSDDRQGLLFLLFESSRVDVYHVKEGASGGGVKRLSTIGNIADQVERICPGFMTSVSSTATANNNNSVVRLVSVEPIVDSPYLSFVATTSTGARLYFSSLPRDRLGLDPIQLSQLPVTEPKEFTLVHVRILIPPSQHHTADDPRRLVHRHIQPSVHAALPGTVMSLFAVKNSDMSDDVVFSIVDPCSILHPTSTGAMERSSVISVEGRVWQIDRLPGSRHVNCQQYITASADPFHSDRFLVLTTVGVYEVEARRLTDMQTIDDMSSLITRLGVEQGMAMVLTSCVENPQLQQFLHSLPSIILSSSSSHNNTDPSAQPHATASNNVTVVKNAFYDAQQLSAVLQGAYACFARIVRPFWNTDLPMIVMRNYAIFTQLKNLKDVMTTNRTIILSSGAARQQQQHLQQYGQLQCDAYYGLLELIGRTAELLSFVMLCQDYQALPADTPCTFDTFFTRQTPDHVKLAADLLVSKQLQLSSQSPSSSSSSGGMASIDGVLQLLGQRCPSFFGKSEMMLYQGMELLERAKQSRLVNSKHDYDVSLTGAIDSLVQSAGSMTFSAFERFTKQQLWMDMESVEGLVRLTTAYAQAMDPDNMALLCYQHPTLLHSLDAVLGDAVMLRERAYGCFLECLSSALQSDKITSLLRHTASCNDELLQVRVFDFMRSVAMTGLLLECMLESPFLEPYLLLQFNTQSPDHDHGGGDDVKSMLLWKYYGLVGRNDDAAQVLVAMASDPSSACSITSRVEWLSRAVTLSMSSSNSNRNGNNTHNDTVDMLDVAMVQLELYNVVKDDSLNTRLWSLSDLFNQVARPRRCHLQALRLLELAILAGNRVKDLNTVISMIWHELIEDTIVDEAVFTNTFKQAIKRFASHDVVCPVLMLLDHISQYAVNTTQPADRVVDLFLGRTGITVASFLDHLDTLLLSNKSTFWHDDKRRDFLVQVLCAVADLVSDVGGGGVECSEQERRTLHTMLMRPYTVSPSTQGLLARASKYQL